MHNYICKVPCKKPLISVYNFFLFRELLLLVDIYTYYVYCIAKLLFIKIFIVMYYCRDVIVITEFLP